MWYELWCTCSGNLVGCYTEVGRLLEITDALLHVGWTIDDLFVLVYSEEDPDGPPINVIEPDVLDEMLLWRPILS